MSVILKGEIREQTGSHASKKVKRNNLIPAVIYGKESNTDIAVDLKEFESLYTKGVALTTVVEIDLNGKKVKVIAHKIDLDPVTDRPIHIDFFNCDSNSEIRAKPKLVFSGKEKSIGLKRGGFLNVVLRRVEVVCENSAAIPHEIDIDASKLSIGAKVRSENIELPKGVRFYKKSSFLIASITGRGKSDDGAEGNAGGEADKKEAKK